MFGFSPHVRFFPFWLTRRKQPNCFNWKKKKRDWIWLAIVFGKTWDSFVATTTAVNREQVFSCVFLVLSCVFVCVIRFFFTCVCVCVGATTLMPCVQVYLVFSSVVVAILGLTSVFLVIYFPSASFVPWLVDSTTSVGQIKKQNNKRTTIFGRRSSWEAGHHVDILSWTFSLISDE